MALSSYDSDRSVEWHKAKLVVFCNHQQTNIYYHETFSPVVMASTIHLVLSVTLTFDWPMRQLDVKNAFLHRILIEEVNMC